MLLTLINIGCCTILVSSRTLYRALYCPAYGSFLGCIATAFKRSVGSRTFFALRTSVISSSFEDAAAVGHGAVRKGGRGKGKKGKAHPKCAPETSFSDKFRTNFDLGVFTLYLSNLVYWVGFGTALALQTHL